MKLPLVIKDRIVLKEGWANNIFYPAEEIQKAYPILNEKPPKDDLAARNRTSLFWDHDDAAKNWLGELKNFRWDPEAKALRADIFIVDEDAARKIAYQLEQNVSRWGISPRLSIVQKDSTATNIEFKSWALCLMPAGGPDLMLAESSAEQMDDFTDIEVAFVDSELEQLSQEFKLHPDEVKNFSVAQLQILRESFQEIHKHDLPFICPHCGYEVRDWTIGECPYCRLKLQPKIEEKEAQIQDDLTTETIESKEFKTRFFKQDDEERIVYGIVLEPDVVDSQGDVIDKEEIRKAMHTWMEEYQLISYMHQDSSGNLLPLSAIEPDSSPILDSVRVIACFQAPVTYYDPESGELIREGTWVLGTRIRDPMLWDKIKRGEITGYSIGGEGIREEI